MVLGASGFEVDFERVDEGHEPGEEFLVDGVRRVGYERGAAFEFHDASEFVSLGARGDVFADPCFKESGDASLEVADCDDGALLLFRRDGGFPAEGEGVDDHEGILMGIRTVEVRCAVPAGTRILWGETFST
jgi:hypothetical protein